MATAETLEAKSQENCALKILKSCDKECLPNCRHYFNIDTSLPEREIVKRYNDFRNDPDYNPQ